MRRRNVWIAVGLVLVPASGLLAWWVWPTPPAEPGWVADYDTTARPPEAIAPGMVIGDTAPPGWSHLVVKSLPRVKPDHAARVPSNLILGRDGTIRMASWLFTAFLADVAPERHGHHTRHRLRAVALGLGTRVNGRDTILTRETAEQFGIEPGFVTNEILTKGYAVQRRAVVALHGPTFALVDTPLWFRCGDKHRLVRYRYALLVDATTGRLDVLLWSLGAEAGGCADASAGVWLNPNTIDEAELVVDPAEFDPLGIPSDGAFAVAKLPAGRDRRPFPPEVQKLAVRSRFTAEDAASLETGLRKVLAVP